jgi:hypothetical protein
MGAQMFRQQAWCWNVVIVHEQKDGRSRGRHPCVFCSSEPKVLLPQIVYWQQSLIVTDKAFHILGRSVIHDNDLEGRRRKGLSQQAFEYAPQQIDAIVRADDAADPQVAFAPVVDRIAGHMRRSSFHWRAQLARRTALPPAANKGRAPPLIGRHQHDGRVRITGLFNRRAARGAHFAPSTGRVMQSVCRARGLRARPGISKSGLGPVGR